MPPPPPPPPPAPEETTSGSRIQGSIFKWVIPILAGLLGIGLLFLLVTLFFLPRFSGGEKSPQPVTLTYWGLWEETPVVKPIIDTYTSLNPHVTINYQQQSHRDYRERLQSALASGSGPDIFRFHNTWVPMLRSELAPVPPTLFDTAAFSSTFYPVAQKDLVVGNSIVGVPLMIDGLGLYYNKTIFTAAGKSPPQNWEELRQTAFDLVVRDQIGRLQTAGIALGTTTNVEHWPDILALMILQNGGNPADPSSTATADALRFYTIFSTSDRVWDDSLPNSIFAFATEKVAMIIAPSWQAHAIKEINPDIDFAIIPVPQLPGNTITWASYWAEGVSEKSQNQEAAFKFLQYLSDRGTLVNFYTEASKVRLFGEPYSRRDLAETLESDEFVGAYITQAPDAQSFYLASRTFDNGINDKIIKYYEDAVNAVNQGEDAQKALQTVAQGVAQVLSQYGIVTQ
ncbi:MAG: extracellular solute-binding protein [Candidatus Chisholmbacteria bacterium]|nr:extracellular solute-binding protein [Candidatus Chisholmbacteria bacterium]